MVNLNDNKSASFVEQATVKFFALNLLCFFQPTLELWDMDLKDEEFQLDKPKKIQIEPHNIIGKEDLLIDQTDEDDENVYQERGGDGVFGPSGVNFKIFKKKTFRSRSILSQDEVEKLGRKYNIFDIYFCQAPKEGEFMSTPTAQELDVSVAYLKPSLRCPLHKLYLWFIKSFWVKSA